MPMAARGPPCASGARCPTVPRRSRLPPNSASSRRSPTPTRCCRSARAAGTPPPDPPPSPALCTRSSANRSAAPNFNTTAGDWCGHGHGRNRPGRRSVVRPAVRGSPSRSVTRNLCATPRALRRTAWCRERGRCARGGRNATTRLRARITTRYRNGSARGSARSAPNESVARSARAVGRHTHRRGASAARSGIGAEHGGLVSVVVAGGARWAAAANTAHIAGRGEGRGEENRPKSRAREKRRRDTTPRNIVNRCRTRRPRERRRRRRWGTLGRCREHRTHRWQGRGQGRRKPTQITGKGGAKEGHDATQHRRCSALWRHRRTRPLPVAAPALRGAARRRRPRRH